MFKKEIFNLYLVKIEIVYKNQNYPKFDLDKACDNMMSIFG